MFICFQNSSTAPQKTVEQIEKKRPDICKIVSISVGIILISGGIFITLAATQILPQKINFISSLGSGIYSIVPILFGIGIGIIVSELRVYFCRTKNKSVEESNLASQLSERIENQNKEKFNDINSKNLINNYEFEQFYNYRKGNDIVSAQAIGTSFFYYECDGINDIGWGCAWRCLQMCGSALNRFPSFKELYNKYRLDPNAQSEWGEPGYGKRYLDDEGITNQLILYNREEGTLKTPTELCKKIKGFSELKNMLINHFKEYATPVMVDDTVYTMSIVGIRLTALDQTILFIADPHKIYRENGLYYVVLDKDGNQIATTGIDNGINGLNTVQHMHFNKDWILLFPQPKLIN